MTANLPTIAYKFLPIKYARTAVGGRLKLSLLTHFHAVEKEDIRDHLEGISQGVFNKPTMISDETPELKRRIESVVRVGPGSRIVFDNVTVARLYPPTYILSLSLDKDCTKWLTGPEPYDAIVTVKSVESLAAKIAACHRDKLGAWTVGSISYTKRISDLTSEGLAALSPFEKPSQFSDESEFRICFDANEATPEPWFITDCGALDNNLSWSIRLRVR